MYYPGDIIEWCHWSGRKLIWLYILIILNLEIEDYKLKHIYIFLSLVNKYSIFILIKTTELLMSSPSLPTSS